LFHRQKKEIRRALIRVGMRDGIAVHQQNLREVAAQQKEKRKKEKIAKAKGLRECQKN